MKISVVLPCRNEEKTIGICIEKIKKALFGQDYEIIVSDSSKDKSAEIAKKAGAKVLKHNLEGYGNAYHVGLKKSKGDYIIMGDADDTYDFLEIPKFVHELDKGYDFVVGNRFAGKIEKGAMPFSHRYLGNPVLSGILRLFFHSKIKDAHCGMRAMRREILEKLNLRTTGMEYASEMVIMAEKKKLKIKQIPISYYKRKGKSKLKSFSDGWRHLRFMLLYSPLFLFFLPGLFLFLFGFGSIVWIYLTPLKIFGITFYFYPMFLSSLLLIAGYQLIIFSAFAKTYAVTHLGMQNYFMERLYKKVTIEKASIIGLLIIFVGLIVYLSIFSRWIGTGFGELNEIKNSILGLTLIVIGIQTIFSSFIMSILGIKSKN